MRWFAVTSRHTCPDVAATLACIEGGAGASNPLLVQKMGNFVYTFLQKNRQNFHEFDSKWPKFDEKFGLGGFKFPKNHSCFWRSYPL